MDEKVFIKRLNNWLSFFYEETDVQNIIYDYEERLTDGNLRIPQSAFSESIKIVRNDDSNPMFAFFKTNKVKSMILYLLFSIVYLVLSIQSGGFQINSIIVIGIIQLLYVVSDTLVWKKQDIPSGMGIAYIGLNCMAIFILPFIIAVASQQRVIDNIGEVIVIFLTSFEIILAVVVLLRGCCNMSSALERQFSLSACAIFTYVISELHVMQSSIFLYIVTVMGCVLLLCVENYVLYRIRIGINRRWTRS